MVSVVDKVALLKAIEQEPELSDEAARDKALAVAHDEDISACQRAIALVMQQSDSKPVSLMQL